MSKKKALGQFFTTNVSKILQGMSIPNGITTIIEPFAGNKDLIQWIPDPSAYTIECYDIDPKHSNVQQRDCLLHPPIYDGKWVLTNPPYLSRNKSSDKTVFDKYKCNDLYKCFMLSLLESRGIIGGILIIPLNFFCSIRKNDVLLRKQFLKYFSITRVNIFEEQVFDDTSYSVCSLQFIRVSNTISTIMTYLYPSGDNMLLHLNDANNYTIGGEIYLLPSSSSHTVSRYTKETSNLDAVTHIIVKCIDDTERISYMYDPFRTYKDDTEHLSCRTYAQLVIEPPLSPEKQQALVQACNSYLHRMREKYHSLFLTNYREGNRKRISFDLIYSIVHYHI